MNNNELAHAYWQNFLKASQRDSETQYFDCFHFDNTEQSANELLALVLAGTKRATASSLFSYQLRGERMPVIGDLSIVTNWEGQPKCVIETTAVSVLLFKDMTFEVCKREGEDDNLESWQRNHIAYFTREAEQEGYTFDWEMPVVFEDFRVIYQ